MTDPVSSRGATGARVLTRHRLIKQMQAAQHPSIAVICCPSGYGKTTLAKQYSQTLRNGTGLACATISMPVAGIDPITLWSRISESVAEALPSVGTLGHSPRRDSAGRCHFDGSFDLLAQNADPLLIVLDDLHFLLDDDCLRLVDELILQTRSTTSFALLSRSDLDDSLQSIADDVIHLGPSDLTFDQSELRRLLASSDHTASQQDHADLPMPITDVPIDVGLWRVGGGIHLPQLHLTGTSEPPPLTEHLLDAVLETLSDVERQFLCETCILDELTVATANKLRRAGDSEQIMVGLEHVLLTRAGSAPRTWHLHGLVRDILRERLEAGSHSSWRDLHRQAASIFAAARPIEAVRHMILAEDFDSAVRLLDTRLADISTAGYIDGPVLLRFLQSIPAPAVATTPSLLVRGLVAARFARRHDIYNYLLAAPVALDGNSVEGLLAEVDAADAAGDAIRIKVSAEAGLRMALPGSRWELDFHSALAHGEELLGNWGAAVASLRRLRRPAALMPPNGRAAQETIHAAIAVNLSKAGDTRGAAAAIAELEAWIAEAADVGYEPEGLLAWATAMLEFHCGRYSSALDVWSTRPARSWFYDQPLVEVIYLLDLARIFARSGRRVDAELLLDELDQTLATFAAPGRFPEWVAVERSRLVDVAGTQSDSRGIQRSRSVDSDRVVTHASLAEDNAIAEVGPGEPTDESGVLTGREFEILRMLSSEFSGPEIAESLCISYNTVKSHVKSLYRKLDAGSRSQAVARGRANGMFGPDVLPRPGSLPQQVLSGT